MQKIILKLENIRPLNIKLFLILTTFIVFGNVLFNGFVWDDLSQVVNNLLVQKVTNIPQLFTGGTFILGNQLIGGYYKPLMSSVFAINYALWGKNPFGFHFFDVVLHAINTILLFTVFTRLFRLERYANPKILALLLTLIFLVHPANTESVAYIASTQEVLYVFFFLITLLLTLSFCETKKLSTIKLSLIGFGSLLSLLSKESGILAILIPILFVFLFFRPKVKLLIFSQFITLSLYALLRFVLAKNLSIHFLNPVAEAPLSERLLTIPYVLFSYLRILFFPKDLYISQFFLVKNIADPRFYLTFPIVFVIFILLIFAAYKLKSKLYIFFLLWTFFSFSIVLNIVPLDASLAERWLYGPMIGLLGMCGVLLHKLQQKYKFLAYIFLVILVISLPILAIRTIVRNSNWKDQSSLYTHDIQENSTSYELQTNYAFLLANEGKTNAAIQHYEISLRLFPHNTTPYNDLAQLYYGKGNIARAKYLEYQAITIDPYNYVFSENLAMYKYLSESPQNTISFTIEALKTFPNDWKLNDFAALAYYRKSVRSSNALYFARKAYAISQNSLTYTVLQNITNYQPIDVQIN